MLSIKLKFRPSSIEGKEGRLYYQVIFNRVARQVSTTFKVFPQEWNPEVGDLVDSSPCRPACEHETIRQAVRNDIRRFLRIERQLADTVPIFTVDVIIAEYHRQSTDGTLFRYMEQTVARYLSQGQHRTSETYAATLNSFKRFRSGADVHLENIDGRLLEAYESYLRQRGLSANTISFYLKHLRAVYNRAVDENLVTDRRPFKRVYTSIEKTAKRAVTLNVIKRLKTMDCSLHPSRRFARDMFLFSFYTRGMSFVDIAYLQKKNLKGNILSYRRKKTNQQLTLYWEPCMQEILRVYAAERSSPYLFSIIKCTENSPRRQYQNALFLVNRHLKEIGKELGLHYPLTMYCARHSWASIAHAEGIPVAVISEGMGHDSEKTTQIYLASLKSEVIDKANRKILKLL